MSLKSIFFFFGFFLIAMVGLGYWFSTHPQSPATDRETVQVAASFYPLAFFAEQIGGEHVHVTTITPAGAEPHEYEPSTSDLVTMERADLLILNGGHLEPWAENVTKNVIGTKVQIVTAGEGLTSRELTEDGKPGLDPHIWLDPLLAKQEAMKIGAALQRIDASHAAYFAEQERLLLAKFDVLDKAYATGLSACQRKDIVTSHAAFGYLAAQYGLTQVPIAGLSPEEEPSTQQLAQTADFVKANHVGTIFFESLVSPKLSQTIAHETGAQTLELNPLEGLTPEEIDQGKNYFTVMEDNLANLKTALVCTQ